MKIVFTILSLGFGGAERVVSVLANELIKEHDVTIVLTYKEPVQAYKLDERISVVPINTTGKIVPTWKAFRKFCKKEKPDAVIAFMTDTGILSAIALAGTGIPVFTSERNDPNVKAMQPSKKLQLLNKFAPFFTAGYVFQSEGARAFFPKKIQKKSCIILNPLNADKLPERDEQAVDNRIVSVGRLTEQKNQKMLINAFARSTAAENHTLHIYGDGNLREALATQIAALGMEGKIILEGNSAHVHEDIKNAKLFAFTSDYEGLPNALMEAMAIGLPCISTDCSPGGARMLIEDGENGILIPCGDEERLTKEFNDLLPDVDRLKDLGEQAKNIRNKTSISTIAQCWLDFVSQSIK